MHRGKIWVESAEGNGSVFHFTIPAVATATPDTTEPARRLRAVA